MRVRTDCTVLWCSDVLVERSEMAYKDYDSKFTTVTYTIVLQRKPLHYIINNLLPCCLFSIIAFVSIIPQPATGGRVELGINSVAIRPHRMHISITDAAYRYRRRTYRSPCVCVRWTYRWALRNRLNRSRCRLGTDSCGPKKPLLVGGADWRHLANTIKRPVCGNDAALSQITFTIC